MGETDASLLANATTPSFFPSKLWIHSKITSKDPTSLVNIKNDKSFFAEKEMSNGDKSPFFIRIQNSNQAKAIHISIIRILIDTMYKSDIWMNDLINDIIELVIGSSQDWEFKPSSSFGQIARKSKKDVFIGRLHELQHRVECATEIFRLARRLPIAHASLSALFIQVIALTLSKQVDAYRSKMHARRYADITSEDQQPPEDEEWTALLALEEAIVDCFMTLYNSIGDPSSRPRLFPILPIARQHRTRLFEILRFEGCEEYRPSDAQATVTNNGKKSARSIPFRIVPASWPRAAISVILIFFGCKVSLASPVNTQDVCDLAPNERMAIDIACGRLVDLSKQPPFPQAGFAEGHKESLYRIMNDLDEQAQNDWNISNAEEYEPNKRKTAPGVEDEELAARLQKREKHKEARLQKLIEDTFPPEVAEKSKVNSKAWQDVIAAYFLEAARSNHSTLEQSQLEAVAILACDHAKDERALAMSGDDHAAVKQACKLCTRNFIMASLEPRDLLQDATFSSTLLSAMQPVHAQICKSSATPGMHVAFWRAFTSLILHNGEHPHLLLSWLDRILQDMTHKKRLVRLAAGYAGNSLITEMYRHNANINPQGALSRLFRGMENVVRSGKPACRLTMATTVADLIR